MAHRKKLRLMAAAALAIPFTLVPVLAGAVETDRVTVEDPATGQIMFKVTSAGNVTGASFNGDGSGLTNVPHFKGAWSGVTAYAKDDCVSYGGSTYIALQPSSNALPDLTPASWAVLAQQGSAGAAGVTGAPGPEGLPGAPGAQGPAGPAGSPDTQAQILSKVAAQADGAVFTVQQGPTEVNTTPKVILLDAAGNQKFVATPQGRIGIGTGNPMNSIDVTVDEASTFVGNFAGTLYTTYSNTGFAQNGFIARQARGSASSPAAVQANDPMFNIGVRGFDGTTFSAWSKAMLSFKAAETWTPTAMGTLFTFETTAPGTTTRTEKMRISGNGNIGIGTTTPTQKFEVKDGGVRINTASTVTKPGCDTSTRGTFWLTQSGVGAMDVLEVCVKDAAEAYVWKAVW